MDTDNDATPVEQRDAPVGETAREVKRSWVTVLASNTNQVGIGQVTSFQAVMAAAYGAKKVVDNIRKPPDPPLPPPSCSASDGEA
jgi:hypothetical protein